MLVILSKIGMTILMIGELIILGIGVAVLIAVIQAIVRTIKNNKKTGGDKNE